MLFTTIQLCKNNKPCTDGYKRMLERFPDHTKDEIIPILRIAEDNNFGLEDGLFALKCTMEDSRSTCIDFCIFCLEIAINSLHTNNKNYNRIIKLERNIRDYAYGDITTFPECDMPLSIVDSWDIDERILNVVYHTYSCIESASNKDAAGHAADVSHITIDHCINDKNDKDIRKSQVHKHLIHLLEFNK